MFLSVLLVGIGLCLAHATDQKVVSIVQTAERTDDRLTPQKGVPLEPEGKASGADVENTLTIDLSKKDNLRPQLGFGGAFTDSTAFNFMQLPVDKQEEFLEAYFGESGLQYSLCRLTIGSSDFSVAHYNYANTTDDYDLADFTIEHDTQYIIPMIKRAQEVARKRGVELEFLSTPWSPPAWMKRNMRMMNSAMPGLRQEEAVFQAWALYFSKYLKAYADEGIAISHVTVQNEPHVAKQFAVTYECCGFGPTNERDFLRDYLGPQMAKDHPSIKIWIHDDQKDDRMVEMVSTVMDDPEAAKFVTGGAAVHWYGDWGLNYDILDQVHEKYPDLPMLGTEATNPRPSAEVLRHWTYGQKYATDILRDMNHHVQGWIDWNMLLDARGGPSNQHLTGELNDLGNCDAPIRANFTSYPLFPVDDAKGNKALLYQPSYYHYGHFTKFVPKGAVHVAMKQEPAAPAPASRTGLSEGLESTAFYVPASTSQKESLVVVVTNFVDSATTYNLEIPGYGSATFKIPRQAIQTLTLEL